MNIKRRKSVQREKIYEIIKNSSLHPTALWIYDLLKSEFPSLSLGNVYRNIKILIEVGRIKIRDFGEGVEHYDAVTDPHYHFICEQCKAINDFMFPIQEKITELAQKTTNHIIKGHSIQFHGVCEQCNNKSNKKGGKK